MCLPSLKPRNAKCNTDMVNVALNKSHLTPESIPDEVQPQIWGTWPEVPSLDMPDIPSEIDWVRDLQYSLRNSTNP